MSESLKTNDYDQGTRTDNSTTPKTEVERSPASFCSAILSWWIYLLVIETIAITCILGGIQVPTPLVILNIGWFGLLGFSRIGVVRDVVAAKFDGFINRVSALYK